MENKTITPSHSCFYCGVIDPTNVVQCTEDDCGKWFCNNKRGVFKSHIFLHLSWSLHRKVKLDPSHRHKPSKLCCSNCGHDNILSLSAMRFKGEMILLCSDQCMTLKKFETAKREKPLISENRIWRGLVNLSKKEVLSTTTQPDLPELIQKEFGYLKKDIPIDHQQKKAIKDHPVKGQYKDIQEYRAVFEFLVSAEEEYSRKIMKNLTQSNVEVKWIWPQRGETLYAELDRTNEDHFNGRLKTGDKLSIRIPGGTEILGYIEPLKPERNIRLKIEDPSRVKSRIRSSSIDCTVSFVWTAVSFDRMKEALKMLELNPHLLPPKLLNYLLGNEDPTPNNSGQKNGKASSSSSINLLKDFSDIQEYKQLNESQKEAAEGSLGSSPLFLIQGPPGTGKTKTLVAIISQLSTRLRAERKKSKILLCAPSNVAANELAERLVRAGVPGIVRVFAFSKEKDQQLSSRIDMIALHRRLRREADPKLKHYFEMKDQGRMLSNNEYYDFKDRRRALELAILKEAQIICCTCITASSPALNDFFFNYVIIDEAGQATEPESLTPWLKGVQKVILAGDHKQIGPIITCKEAQYAGLNKSLFERLFATAPHIRLAWQYRMHPHISEFPSNHFYDGELKTHPSVKRPLNPALKWRKNLPSYFHHVIGLEEIPVAGVSYFNREEASVIKSTVLRLISSGIKPEVIGIISPYNGQKNYLAKMFDQSENLKAVEISSVDGFQGREKDYIVVSCVRSNEELGVGFLSDEKRLNVTITRAKYGLIICGNAETLCQDPNWKALLKYYKEKNLLLEGDSTCLQVAQANLNYKQHKFD